MRMKMCSVFVMLVVVLGWVSAADGAGGRIRPCDENPRYWQYKGQAVSLLGGSETDHIFLLDDLKSHLDEIVGIGAI